MEAAIFTIGSLAARASVSIDSIRFYERRRLISATGRTSAGYRLYGEDALRRIAFIKHAQHCGISLEDIKVLLDAGNGATAAKLDAACQLGREKLNEIPGKIAALRAMSDALATVVAWCSTKNQLPQHGTFPLLSALEAAVAANEGNAGRKA
jgi:DNA-binding transcriptional MerR regulator